MTKQSAKSGRNVLCAVGTCTPQRFVVARASTCLLLGDASFDVNKAAAVIDETVLDFAKAEYDELYRHTPQAQVQASLQGRAGKGAPSGTSSIVAPTFLFILAALRSGYASRPTHKGGRNDHGGSSHSKGKKRKGDSKGFQQQQYWGKQSFQKRQKSWH